MLLEKLSAGCHNALAGMAVTETPLVGWDSRIGHFPIDKGVLAMSGILLFFGGSWQDLERSPSLAMGWDAPNLWLLPMECQGGHCLSALNQSRFRMLNQRSELVNLSDFWAV